MRNLEHKISDYQQIFKSFENNANEQQAVKMASYMKNKFSFLGIPKRFFHTFLLIFMTA